MEDEVDEGLEEEDAMAMAVGPLRPGRGTKGKRAGRFGLACLGSNESLAESVVYIVALACLLAAPPIRCAEQEKDRNATCCEDPAISTRSSSIGIDQLGTLEDGSRRRHHVFCSVHVDTEKFMEGFCKKGFLMYSAVLEMKTKVF